jgi:multiple sugar transport system substrate-binding protein
MDNIGFNEQATRDFTAETGIEVELIYMGWDNVADRVIADLTAGGGSYDVIEFDNAWVAKFYENDWLEPLDSYISEEMRSGLLQGLLETFSSDGKLYGIPWNNDTRFFMYNAAILQASGFSKPPETWEQLEEMSLKLKADGLPYGYMDAYPALQSGANEVTAMVYSFGGELFDADGQPVMGTDPKTKAAFEFMVKSLNDTKIADPASLTADYETVENVFISGDTAFFIQAWPGVFQSANDPTLSLIVDQIAVADVALHANGAEQVVLTLPEAMAIPKTSKNKAAAWQYIEYMSGRDLDKERALAIGSLPLWQDLYTDTDLTTKYPYWANFSGQIAHARALPSLTYYDEYANILMEEAHMMFAKTKTVEKGLADLQERCEALAGKYTN